MRCNCELCACEVAYYLSGVCGAAGGTVHMQALLCTAARQCKVMGFGLLSPDPETPHDEAVVCVQDDLSPELQAVTRIVGALQAMQQMRMPAALGGSAGEEDESKRGKDEKDKSGDKEQSESREEEESKAGGDKVGAAEAERDAADSKAGGEGEAPDGAEGETWGEDAGKDERSPESYEPCVPGRVIFLERCGLVLISGSCVHSLQNAHTCMDWQLACEHAQQRAQSVPAAHETALWDDTLVFFALSSMH